jgi:hypothetical protein
VTAAVKPKAKATVERPRTPRDVADREALVRIAGLAASVLVSSRRVGRGVWESERVLRSWLAEDGISFSSSDLAPALALLETACPEFLSRGPANGSAWMGEDAIRCQIATIQTSTR